VRKDRKSTWGRSYGSRGRGSNPPCKIQIYFYRDDLAPSPGPGAPFRSSDPLGVPPPLGPGTRGHIMFVFPRLVVVDVSIIHLAAVSLAGGAARTRGFAAAARDVSERRVSAGILCPALRADVSGVLRAPWGPDAALKSLLKLKSLSSSSSLQVQVCLFKSLSSS
jgi:hypothetical protein